LATKSAYPQFSWCPPIFEKSEVKTWIAIAVIANAALVAFGVAIQISPSAVTVGSFLLVYGVIITGVAILWAWKIVRRSASLSSSKQPMPALSKQPMPGIFLSYRRDDSDMATGRLTDDLSEEFGSDVIFRDIDRLELGLDYEEALKRALDTCTVLLAVIGPRWSTISDNEGRRRLSDSKDWVRTEIASALSRGIRVIPVLVSGAPMPQEIELPADLIALSKRQAFQLEDRYWKQGFALLTESIDDLLAGKVRISGSKQWVRRNHARIILTVFVDDKELSSLELFGGETIFRLNAGSHNLYVAAPHGISNAVDFYLQHGHTQYVSVTWGRMFGTLHIDLRESPELNAPKIPQINVAGR
jgi:hypothetical protein